MSNSLGLLKCGSEDKDRLWFSRVLLLFKKEVRGKEEEPQFAIVQYIECSHLPDNLDKAM